MSKNFILHFEQGMPKGTAQQKGVAIRYKNGEPYIQHYKKDKVAALREEFMYRLNRYAPRVPYAGPVRLSVLLCFDVKDKKLWGKYKTTRPDGDNYIKELKDAMTECGFWGDDSQVADERVVRVYSEKAAIRIQVEELRQPGRLIKA